jgi:hypothetical protein
MSRNYISSSTWRLHGGSGTVLLLQQYHRLLIAFIDQFELQIQENTLNLCSVYNQFTIKECIHTDERM